VVTGLAAIFLHLNQGIAKPPVVVPMQSAATTGATNRLAINILLKFLRKLPHSYL